MTPTAYRAALSALGMSASSFAAMLGRPRNTVIAWGDPKRGGPPDDVAKWLERRLSALQRDPPPIPTNTAEQAVNRKTQRSLKPPVRS